MSNENGNKPLVSFKERGFNVSLWSNSGKNGEYFSVSLQKRYKDKETGDWKIQQINILGSESLETCISLLSQIREQMG